MAAAAQPIRITQAANSSQALIQMTTVDEATALIFKRAEATLQYPKMMEALTLMNPGEVRSAKIYVLAGMEVGVMAGAGIGFAAGGPVGAAIGTAPGLVVGGIGGYVYFMIKNSREFEKWRAKQTDESMAAFRKAFDSEPQFANFVCSISTEIMQVPSTTPCGHTFEYDAIIEHIEKRKGKEEYLKDANKDYIRDKDGNKIKAEDYGVAECPLCRTYLTERDLRVNSIVIGQLLNAYNGYVSEKTGDHKLTKDQMEGVKKLQKDLQVRAKWIFDIEEEKLLKLVKAGAISQKEYHKRAFLLLEAMGQES